MYEYVRKNIVLDLITKEVTRAVHLFSLSSELSYSNTAALLK